MSEVGFAERIASSGASVLALGPRIVVAVAGKIPVDEVVRSVFEAKASAGLVSFGCLEVSPETKAVLNDRTRDVVTHIQAGPAHAHLAGVSLRGNLKGNEDAHYAIVAETDSIELQRFCGYVKEFLELNKVA